MNISGSAMGGNWFSAVNSSAAKPGWHPTGGLEDRLYGSGPESMKNLTKADREVIKATTGIDIRDNGEIGSPASMSAMDYGTAIYGIQELAGSRAHGQTAQLAPSDFLHGLAIQGYANSAKWNIEQYQGFDFRA